jgi:hypothetical protein
MSVATGYQTPILLSSNLSTTGYTDSLHEDVKTDDFGDTRPKAFRRNVTLPSTLLYPQRVGLTIVVNVVRNSKLA